MNEGMVYIKEREGSEGNITTEHTDRWPEAAIAATIAEHPYNAGFVANCPSYNAGFVASCPPPSAVHARQ